MVSKNPLENSNKIASADVLCKLVGHISILTIFNQSYKQNMSDITQVKTVCLV